MDRVIIYDTTLRDGEQAPGFSMDAATKLRLGRQLAELAVDVMEVGFPAASPDEFVAVRQIAAEIVDGPVICALARAAREDIDRAGEALRAAGRKRIHTFIGTSDLHMELKLRLTRQEVVERALASVRQARQYTDDVQFGFEDASRSDRDFLCQLAERVIDAGARTLDIGDTVGYAMPSEFASLVGELRGRVANIDKAVIAVHCHNDLGLAVANSVAALQAGARQVDCTINGIGERAGNASLEEVVMALYVRRAHFGLETGVRRQEIFATSQLLESVTGIAVQPNKAIVGKNAFSHEAGIHQHAVLVNPLTYEIMTPESVGVPSNRLVLGKHSGRHAVRKFLGDLGVPELPPAEFERLFDRFKTLADRQKTVTSRDLLTLAGR